MELRELRSFCTAARLKSISKAAVELGIGQPTVTTHVKKLEQELGMVLFDRVKRPIQLTLSGTELYELAAPLVEGIDTLATRTSAAEEEGPVSVASTHEIVPHTLLRVVKVFLARHPHVHLRIWSGVRADVLDMVSQGEVDIGIAPGHDIGVDFDFMGLFGYERVAITPLGHPLLNEPLHSIEQLAQWPLILMGKRTHTRAILEGEFRRKGLPYEIVVELDSFDVIKRYVALGMGISAGPRLAIEPEDQRELGVKSLANLLPVEQAGIVTLRGKVISTPAQKLISTMMDVLAPASSRRRR